MQIAGQKAETLPRFDRRAREDNAVDLFIPEGRHGRRHREKGFARSGGADAEGDGVVFNRVNVFLLADRFGLYRLALARDADNVARDLVDLALAALFDKLYNVADILLVDILSARGEGQKARNGLFSQHDAFFFARDVKLGLTVGDFDAKLVFNDVDIAVKGAKDADDLLHTVDRHNSLYHSVLFSSLGVCARWAVATSSSVIGTSFAMFCLHCARRVATS